MDRPRVTYEARGWMKDVDEDIFARGCGEGEGFTTDGNDLFRAGSPTALLKVLQSFAGIEYDDDPEESIIRWEDEPGRIDIQVLEDTDGLRATPRQIERWKVAEERLFLCTYTFECERVTRRPMRAPHHLQEA